MTEGEPRRPDGRLSAGWREAEWLEADGAGGFASGTVSGCRTRRYHALLAPATTPPTGRVVLVNGLEAWLDDVDQAQRALSSQHYAPGVDHPDGDSRIVAFAGEPWPTWRFRTEAGTELSQEIVVDRASRATLVRWRVIAAAGEFTLHVRLLLSGRDYHALLHEDPAQELSPERSDETLVWWLGAGLPGVAATPGGRFSYAHAPTWYRNFSYEAERRRGLDHIEDLAAPGVLSFVLDGTVSEASITLRAVAPGGTASSPPRFDLDAERSRRRAGGSVPRAASAFIVGGDRTTIIAGYPWFTDWGRDTFIAVRGLCIALGDLDRALEILLAWAGTVDAGMLPNHFPDGSASPEFNAVDASLWFVIAVHDALEACRLAGRLVAAETAARLEAAVDAIIDGYSAGTRFNIREDDDGLIAAGVAGVQLTWMDAKVGDHVVTPRIGKPVEVQALWINALSLAAGRRPELGARARRAIAAFRAAFLNEADGTLYDVVDVDHVKGRKDPSVRPNQVFAAGGLPVMLLDAPAARRVIDNVEARLLTPYGLRTLSPGADGYVPHFAGDVGHRDGAYHQGTVWPWLIGPFVEAWLKVHRGERHALSRAGALLAPLRAYRDGVGLGHVFEVADAEPPHEPGGCPAQAWSLGELIRAERLVAGEDWRAPRGAEVAP